MGKETKYFKDIIYQGENTSIYSIRKKADLKTLIAILKEKPISRKELIEKTYWTRGQIAGLLYRGIKRGLFKLEKRKIYLIDKNNH